MAGESRGKDDRKQNTLIPLFTRHGFLKWLLSIISTVMIRAQLLIGNARHCHKARNAVHQKRQKMKKKKQLTQGVDQGW
jgi:hypothetical protein